MMKLFSAALCVLCVFALNFKPLSADPYRYELSIGAIFQNEAPYLKEWIEFHKLVGVEHFYLYENGSSDDYQSVLKPYIERGEVELFEWPYQGISWDNWIQEIQPFAYLSCILRAQGKTKWLALIDIDEFLTPISATHVPDILKDYETFAGVGFNWKIFGHSDLYDLPPNKLLIESLVMTAPLSRPTHLGVKSIIRPEFVEDCKHPHYVIYKDGYHHVDSNREQTINSDGASAKTYYDRLVVNHYWSRTGRYLYNKLKRYKPWNPHVVPENWKDYVAGMNEVPDHTMERFIEPLRQRMGLDPLPLLQSQEELASIDLDAYLKLKGYHLNPAGTQNEEGYITPAQKRIFIEELRMRRPLQIAEVGFNAGHTAEIFLESVKSSRVVSFDLNTHYYTRSAVEFMKCKYKDRFQFVGGDSRFTVSEYSKTNPTEKFDLIYIDGGHQFECCMADIMNFKDMAHKDSILWIDDYNYHEVKKAVDLAERLHLIQLIKQESAQDNIGLRVWAEARYLF